MIGSSEAVVREEIDMTGPKDLVARADRLVEKIAPVARNLKPNLLQNEVRITPKTSTSSDPKKYILRLMQNGVKAKQYDYHISIYTSKGKIPVYLSIGGTVPTNEEHGKIDNAWVVTNKGTKYAKTLKVDILPNGSISLVKDNLGPNKAEILDVAYNSMRKVGESLESSQYDTEFTPKEEGMDQIVGGLSEIPQNLN